MEALYYKLYEKYSKLKSDKENYMDQINKDQEDRFVEFSSAAESLADHLAAENKKLSEYVDKLRTELVSLRRDKDLQFIDLQARIMEEKQKNQQLSLEVEQLQNLRQERTFSSNRKDQHGEQHINSNSHSLNVTRRPTVETPMRMTRKRARLFEETNPGTSSPAVSHAQVSVPKELSTGPAASHAQVSVPKELSTDQSKSDASKTNGCQGILVNEDPCKCMFQRLVENLVGMKFSVVDQPEGKSLGVVHQSSGYSFSLTWQNTPTNDEGEFLYRVSSLGMFKDVALEWMREEIIFGMDMCPVFFEKVKGVIKRC